MARPKLDLSQLATGIIIPLLILGIGVFGYFLLLPKYQDIKVLRGVYVSKQATLEERRAEAGKAQSLVSDLADKKQDLGAIEEALPEAPGIPQLLSNLEFLSKQSGLSVKSIELTPAQTLATAAAGLGVELLARAEELSHLTDELGVIKITLTVSGQYSNSRAFMKNVEQNLRIFDMDTLSFGGIQEKTGSQDFTFVIFTYYQKPKA